MLTNLCAFGVRVFALVRYSGYSGRRKVEGYFSLQVVWTNSAGLLNSAYNYHQERIPGS